MTRSENRIEAKGHLRAAVIAAAAIACLGLVFTIGFFIGRGTGGTEVRVYVQNSEGVYTPAQTAIPTEPTQVPLLRSRPEEPAQTSTARPVAASKTPSTTAGFRLIETETPPADTSAASQTDEPAETSASDTTSETTTVRQTTTAAKATTPGVININTASQSQLETLPGIGPVKAAAIVAYRQEHGAFKSVEDLVKVSGIGKKTLETIQAHITVG